MKILNSFSNCWLVKKEKCEEIILWSEHERKRSLLRGGGEGEIFFFLYWKKARDKQDEQFSP